MPTILVNAIKQHPEKIYLSGGLIRNSITTEATQDIDIFAASKGILNEVMLSMNQISWTKGINTFYSFNIRPIIQLYYKNYFEQPVDFMANADFTISACVFWWSGSHWDSCVHNNFYSDLAAKRLVYVGEKDNNAFKSLIRVNKLLTRGYAIPTDEFSKILASGYELIELNAGQTTMLEIQRRFRELVPPSKW